MQQSIPGKVEPKNSHLNPLENTFFLVKSIHCFGLGSHGISIIQEICATPSRGLGMHCIETQ